MRREFERIFKEAKTDEVDITVEKIGDRPCKGDVDPVLEKELVDVYTSAVKEFTGKDTLHRIASTDANIPMSMGIPAVCMGAFINFGSHTREEYTNKASLTDGLKISIRVLTELTE